MHDNSPKNFQQRIKGQCRYENSIEEGNYVKFNKEVRVETCSNLMLLNTGNEQILSTIINS
jgi:hypothetical protein